MRAVVSRAAVATAAGALVLGVGLLPVDAQVVEPTVSVTGTARCNLGTGHETYTLEWTVTNNTAYPGPTGANSAQGSPGAIDIESATESGAWTGSVTMTPTFLEIGDSATGSDGPVPNTTGAVTLTVSYFYGAVTNGVATGTITLDGTCTAPPPSDSVVPTTAPPSTAAARAVAARPAFTG